VDLDENGVQETTVDAAIQAANLEIDSTIYNYDGTLTGNRTLTGASNSLTFTDVASLVFNSSTVDVTSTNAVNITSSTSTVDVTGSGSVTVDGSDVTVQVANGDVARFESDQDIEFRSSSLDSTLYIDADGTVKMSDYGTGSNSGNEAYLLGVTSDGTLLDVNVNTIGGDALLSSAVDLDENGVQETTVDAACGFG
jgi:hypothetical protein